MGRKSTDCREALLSHLHGLYGYAMSLCRDQAVAEDLVQETYVQAASHFDGFREGSNLKGWLFTILRNLWFKELRHARSGPEFVTLDDASEAGCAFESLGDPEVLYVHTWEREEIRTALESLPQEHREAIILRDFEGFSYKEMAELLSCPVGTVMSRLARARTNLKRVLIERQSVSLTGNAPGRS